MNLLEKAQDLLEGAKEAKGTTPWSAVGFMVEGEGGDDIANCSVGLSEYGPESCMANAEYIAAANPETISQLAEALIEIVALIPPVINFEYYNEDHIAAKVGMREFLRKHAGETK